MRNAHFQHKTLWQGDRDTTLIGKQQAIQSPKPPASHSDAMVQVAGEHSSSKRQGTRHRNNRQRGVATCPAILLCQANTAAST